MAIAVLVVALAPMVLTSRLPSFLVRLLVHSVVSEPHVVAHTALFPSLLFPLTRPPAVPITLCLYLTDVCPPSLRQPVVIHALFVVRVT